MLVCPQCQFDNPDTNKFCQQCGTSLTHTSCPECNTQVAYSAKNCPNCGTVTGTIWWVLLSKKPGLSNAELLMPKTPPLQEPLSIPQRGDLDADPLTVATPPETPEELQVVWEEESLDLLAPEGDDQSNPFPPQYLDSQQRYLLLDALSPWDATSTQEQQVRVLDRQPLRLSPLEILLEQEQAITIADLSSPKSDSNSTSEVWEISISGSDKTLTLPAIAKAYLVLEAQFYRALPKIHDAWIAEDETQIILLEDRDSWPILSDLWRRDEIQQIHLLYLLYETVSLWKGFEEWNCCRSLLELKNLRLDEDQALVIQRLYLDSPDSPPTIEVLSQVWQELMHQSDQTISGPLAVLVGDLKQEKIQTIDELLSCLQAIASELQPEPTPSTTMPPVESNSNTIQPPPSVTESPQLHQNDYPSSFNVADDMPTVVLPMQLLSLEDAGRTDVGRQRRHNEDYFGIWTELTKKENPLSRTVQAKGLYVLCDGMGGHAGGEVASALAVKTLHEYFQTHWNNDLPDEDCIREGVLKANQVIYDMNQQDARSGSGRMGTTLVMILVQDTQVAAAHVGDSRIYRLSRRQGLEQITVDHEVGQREITRGVDPAIAYSRPDAYQLTQALGPRNEHFVVPDIQFFELNEDTLLLLCSDGLSDNNLVEKNWQTHLQPLLSSRTNLEQGASELIELGNQYNGHDNITAVLIRAKVRPDLEQARVGNA